MASTTTTTDGSMTSGVKEAVWANFFSNDYVKFLINLILALLIVAFFIFISKVISTLVKKKYYQIVCEKILKKQKKCLNWYEM